MSKMSLEDARRELKRRSRELWHPPSNGVGFAPLAVFLRTAKKREGLK